MPLKTHLQLEPSPTVNINTVALNKKAEEYKIYNLCAGEPMVDMSDLIKYSIVKALEDGQTHYPPVAGLPELRREAVLWMNNTYKTHFNIKESVVTPGGKFGLFLLLQALVEKGDEVLIPAPYWVSYPSIVKLFGGESIVVDTDEGHGWKLDVADLENSITTKTKILILNNASNPTGVLYTREDLRKILDVAERHNLIVISDEVYSGLVYEGVFVSCGSFAEYADRVFVVQSCSKQFAMTGLRVGFVFGPEEIITLLITLLGHSTTGVVTLSQYAALAGFEHANMLISSIRNEMKERRDIFVDTFNTLFGTCVKKPESSLYVFLKLEDFGTFETSSKKFCAEVLENSGVAMVHGSAFGKEGYVRCSFGGEKEELLSAIRALSLYLKK